MMKQALALFIFLLGLLLPSVSPGADVYLNVEGLTVNIQDEPLEGVLRDLAQQAEFDLMILQIRDFAGETISDEFHNLSLEEGVHRLLPAWNYGITKNKRQDRFTTCLWYPNEIHRQNAPLHFLSKAHIVATILNKPIHLRSRIWKIQRSSKSRMVRKGILLIRYGIPQNKFQFHRIVLKTCSGSLI